ncbi:hypothetical protein LZC95_34970 [Pendulispora brunnea]|uniref:Uncharacterized protein n=1 Tax=Pendulispora brunnea TaxID=2905690 RepID=A0ABZ2JYS4_9BACT
MSARLRSQIACGCLFFVVSSCTSHDATTNGIPPLERCRSGMHGLQKPMYHGNRERLGWNDTEDVLTPAAVQGGHFQPLWNSAPFDGAKIEGQEFVGRAYASLLYADDIHIRGGVYDGAVASVVYGATSNGWVYAVNAFEAPCAARSIAPGAFLWRTRTVTPAVAPTLDGRTAAPAYSGIAVGTLSTPILDLEARPPRLYVTAQDTVPGGFPVWKAFALDAESGAILPGWPVVMSRAEMEKANKNGPAYFDDDARIVSQRGALALSPDRERLYVTFAGYYDGAVGWIAAIDTHAPAIAASFSGAPDTASNPDGSRDRHANAGMWAPSGPAVTPDGHVLMSTGNTEYELTQRAEPRTWGNSVLRWTRDLDLEATYTPYNYCPLDQGDVDVGGSSLVLLPELSAIAPKTPHLMTVAGKQGVVYLLDADHLPANTERRPACSIQWDDASRDLSLLPPEPDGTYCDVPTHDPCTPAAHSDRCVRGPLLAFGPAGDIAAVDHAKMRTTPAFFRAKDGAAYLYVAGTTKAALCSIDAVPPSVLRLRIASANGTAYLARDGADTELRLVNPGSPVVSSHGGEAPVVWVVDQNALRTQPLLDPNTPHPVLVALDGTSLRVLYRSGPSDLFVGGKYVTPVVAHGRVFVATDRVQAFGVAP